MDCDHRNGSYLGEIYGRRIVWLAKKGAFRLGRWDRVKPFRKLNLGFDNETMVCHSRFR